MGEKKFRDPIYGYIAIDEQLVKDVIDTATFQRLRDIIQTSYAPLYSSAVHNRFVHSIGVYHLGRLATQTLLSPSSDHSSQLISMLKQYTETFELACLLHDVGHAPFSHTGEMLYLQAGERSELHRMLVDLTGDEDLEQEIKNNSYKAAPHELMSAILSLKVFSDIIPEEKRSFFARCICGYKYANHMDDCKSCMNCLIELLNSKIIDVDKLDYLLRDAYMTGFDTVTIDYVRLLESIRLRKNSQDRYEICYAKSAVSVLENVVYAHDAERKWIQTHPIDFLLTDGVFIEGLGNVKLMGDSDVRYLMKNLPDQSWCREYYERKLRKHPVWKTEAEFKFEFLIIYTNQFNSGFRKQEFGNIKILFPELKNPCEFGDVSNVLKSEKSKGEKFFFLYYDREGKNKEISITKLVERMLTLAGQFLVKKSVTSRLL